MSGRESISANLADRRPRVAIIGGGLAGLAAAVRLVEHDCQVELFEARRTLGGRAGSFRDPETGEWLDHCQHVGMGCCTNLRDLFERTGCESLLRRYHTLHFFGPDGRRCDFRSSPWLPAPLHLANAFWRQKYLTAGQRRSVARTLLRLARQPATDSENSPSIGRWLREQHVSQVELERFWSVVLVSALGETLEHASLAAARKVFVDGFMRSRDAYVIDVPTVPLARLYDEYFAGWLRSRGAGIHCGVAAQQLHGSVERVTGFVDQRHESHAFDAVVIAVPWRRVADLIPNDWHAAWPKLSQFADFASSPITSVHLWLDRPITDLPHAVIVGRLSQWLFRRKEEPASIADAVDSRTSPANQHYYQVVISASRDLATRDREDVVREVMQDLAAIWPAADSARLLRWQLVTQREAVFSVRPGFEQRRPPQATPIRNLFLAGDWTQTGWPATMEGAVRSGYLAAARVLESVNRPADLLAPDLPMGRLARWLFQS
ncbi:MAG: hydroxysqualene dehydroxylase HpnE [Planctomycetales bacterium]|nr:hydroxysqualene dehydroxylase HpnE [Planctomycetales bacterium]